MSKPGGGTSSGISSGDVLIPPERHPACRRREARPGSGTERENLAGGAKGKGASGSYREAESTDAPERGRPPRSSDETAVMAVRRGRVTAVGSGSTVNGRSSAFNGRRQPSRGGTSRTPYLFASTFFVVFSRFFSLSFWRPEPKSRRRLSGQPIVGRAGQVLSRLAIAPAFGVFRPLTGPAARPSVCCQASTVSCDRTWHSRSLVRDLENQAAAFLCSANEPSNSVLFSSMAQAT
jgi:hypothetical protein